MRGLMSERPLLVSALIEHAARFHGDIEIVSRLVDGSLHRYTYLEAERRSRRLARAVLRLGVAPGDRIGTLAWNTYRHFELYFGVSGMGAVCHTINPRLFDDQIVYIIGHADDRFLLVEPAEADFPVLATYDELVAAEDEHGFAWPEFDELTAAALCYTSGTTG